MDILSDGKFVDLTGSKSASLRNGAWEMIWKRNASAGTLMCGFDVPEEVKRNGALLPKGRMFVVSTKFFAVCTNLCHVCAWLNAHG